MRYKVLPARLVGGLSGTKFSLQARNGLVSPFCGVLGEFCPAHRVRLPDRRGCEACGGCICGAEGRRPDWRVARGLQGLAGLRGDAPSEARGAVGERAGRLRAARKSGGVRRTEVWRGAPSEARWDGGCGAGGHGRPIGGWCEACRAWPGFEATRRAKLAARSASGRAGFAPHGDLAGLAPHGGLATGCLADGERAGRRPPAHRADADNRMCWA